MNEGKKFEQDFKKSINEKEIYCLRIQDNASGFGTNSNIRFTMKPPYDYLLFDTEYLFAMELKSTKSTSVSFDKEAKTKQHKMIHYHQIEELTKLSGYRNACGGFLFNFRTTERTWYLDVRGFNKFFASTDKQSINEKDIEMFGGILVDTIKKRTRFEYDILSLLQNIKERNEDYAKNDCKRRDDEKD